MLLKNILYVYIYIQGIRYNFEQTLTDGSYFAWNVLVENAIKNKNSNKFVAYYDRRLKSKFKKTQSMFGTYFFANRLCSLPASYLHADISILALRCGAIGAIGELELRVSCLTMQSLFSQCNCEHMQLTVYTHQEKGMAKSVST